MAAKNALTKLPGITKRMPFSQIEVERKFLPSVELSAFLNDSRLQSQCLVLTTECTSPDLIFHHHTDQLIRDTYYDARSQLESQGIWLRHRSTRFVKDRDLPSLASGENSIEQWEAKIKLGGDYSTSEFLEIEGRKNVVRNLQRRVPGFKGIEKLVITADLETKRSTWNVKEAKEGKEKADEAGFDRRFCVALDHVTEAGISLGPTAGFEHYIGELEMVGDASAKDDAKLDFEKRATAKYMSSVLDQFMARHAQIFITEAKPVGKLGAFFAWKAACSSVP